MLVSVSISSLGSRYALFLITVAGFRGGGFAGLHCDTVVAAPNAIVLCYEFCSNQLRVEAKVKLVHAV